MAKSVYDSLDPAFAGKLRALIAAGGGKIGITDGFRTRAQQADLYRRKPGLAAPPGRSLHERGLAADLSGDLGLAHQLAAQFGLSFPMLSGSKIEPWHVQMGDGSQVSGGGGRGSGTAGGTAAVGGTGMADTPNFQNELIQRYGPGLSKLLDQMMQGGYAPTAQALYDPSAAQPDEGATLRQPWMNWDAGGAAQWPEMQYGPSDRQEQNRYDLDSVVARGKQAGLMADAIRNHAKLASAMSAWDKANPAPQMESAQLPAAPQRQYAPMPERPEPRLDPMAGALAAIAGFVDPQASGMYGAAPLNAAVEQSQKQFGDNILRFNLLTEQYNRQLEDAERAHQLAVDQALNNQKVRFVNRQSDYQRQRQALEADLKAQGLLSDADIEEERARLGNTASFSDLLSKMKANEIADKTAKAQALANAAKLRNEQLRENVEEFRRVLGDTYNAQKPVSPYIHGSDWIFDTTSQKFLPAPMAAKPADPLLSEKRDYLQARTQAVRDPYRAIKNRPEYINAQKDLQAANQQYLHATDAMNRLRTFGTTKGPQWDKAVGDVQNAADVVARTRKNLEVITRSLTGGGLAPLPGLPGLGPATSPGGIVPYDELLGQFAP